MTDRTATIIAGLKDALAYASGDAYGCLPTVWQFSVCPEIEEENRKRLHARLAPLTMKQVTEMYELRFSGSVCP